VQLLTLKLKTTVVSITKTWSLLLTSSCYYPCQSVHLTVPLITIAPLTANRYYVSQQHHILTVAVAAV
jgi:hypothetical protein